MPRTNKKQMLKGVRYAAARLMDNSTVMYYRKNGDKVIRVHHDDILTFKPSGELVIDTAGKRTYLQRRRINAYQALVKIIVHKGKWIVARANHDSHWRKLNRLPAYVDGMTVTPTGKLIF